MQTALQFIAAELRTLMENPEGCIACFPGQRDIAPNRGEQSEVVVGSSGMHGINNLYQDLQVSKVPSFLGSTMLGLPVG